MSLDQLQKIRTRRLEKQLTEVQNKKDAVHFAQSQVQQCQQELQKFHLWRLSHQEALFKGLTGQVCSPQSMMDYHSTLSELTQREEQLKAAIPLAEQQLQQAKQDFEKARQEANALALKNEKTKEIVNIQNKNLAKQAIAKELTEDA